MFTFEQQIKAWPVRSVLYPKIIKACFFFLIKAHLLSDMGNYSEKV